jgi:hypothetical protein
MEYPCRGWPARLRRISSTGSVRGKNSIVTSDDMSYNAIMRLKSAEVKRGLAN